MDVAAGKPDVAASLNEQAHRLKQLVQRLLVVKAQHARVKLAGE